MTQDVKYVVVTPVRDEEKHLEATVEAVIGQTIKPAEWVIVNDGSSDRTGDIIDRYATKFPWISAVHRSNRGFRKSGGGVIEAFYEGYRALRCEDWEFIAKLDGDLTFSADYFEKCFEHFRTQPRLGVGGGDIYHDLDGVSKLEANPRFHVRGATKIYRRACWEAIGGLLKAPGWDSIDEVKANMLGWKSYSFAELRIAHHRITGSAEGALRDRVKHGVACYISGYHPLFVAASCFYRMNRRPYIIGSAAICYGFLKGYLTRIPRVDDASLIKYLRTQQLRRLCGLETIWK
jgi:biofilm PGA synthesis N-glycosyltransferase PgaC